MSIEVDNQAFTPAVPAEPLSLEQPPIEVIGSSPANISENFKGAVSGLQSAINYTRKTGIDSIDAQEARRVFLRSLMITIPTAAGFAFEGGPAAVGVSTLSMLGAGMLFWAKVEKHIYTGRVELSEGYGLQPIPARRNVPDADIKKGDVSLVVLPRISEVGVAETASSAKKHLSEALEVGLATDADRFIVPDPILVSTLPELSGRVKFGSLIREIADRKLIVPDEDQPCLSISRVMAQSLIERLGVNNIEGLNIDEYRKWERVLIALGRRFPNNTGFRRPSDQNSDPRPLVSTINHLVPLAVEEHLLSYQIRLNGSRTERLKDNLYTTIDTSGEHLYDPIIRQHAPGQYNPDGVTLSDIVSKAHEGQSSLVSLDDSGESTSDYALNSDYHGESTTDYILGRLEKGLTCTDAELLFTALQLLKDYDPKNPWKAKIAEVDPPQEQELVTVEQFDNSKSPKFISIQEHDRRNFRKSVRQLVAKLAIVGVIAGSLSFFVDGAVNALLPVRTAASANADPGLGGAGLGLSGGPVGIGQAIVQNAPIWKIESQGIDADGYYPEMLYNELDAKLSMWLYSGGLIGSALDLPTQLKDINTPRIEVTKWLEPFNGGGFPLPVKTGTSIGSISVVDEKGQPVNFKLFRLDDDIFWITISNIVPVFINYNLVNSNADRVHATKPLTIRGLLNDSPPIPQPLNALAGFGATALAKYEATHFKYTDSEILNRLVDTKNPLQIVRNVLKAKKCNCNICSTTLGIVMGDLDPKELLEFTAGFHHTGKLPYLLDSEGHAWMTTSDGKIVDSTPPGSLGLGKPTLADLNRIWADQDPIKNRLPEVLLLLAIIGGAAVLGAESKYELGQKAAGSMIRGAKLYAATRSLAIEDSYHLLNWLSYAQGGKIPQMSRSYDYSNAKWSNIPYEVLTEVANGSATIYQLSPRQRTSLRRTAGLVLNKTVRAKEPDSSNL